MRRRRLALIDRSGKSRYRASAQAFLGAYAVPGPFLLVRGHGPASPACNQLLCRTRGDALHRLERSGSAGGAFERSRTHGRLVNTQFPSLAALFLSSPQVSASAELAIWTSPDQQAPSVPPCDFASSRPLSFPAAGSLRPTGVVIALSEASWQLNSTFFTPRRRIASPGAMRPLRAPESYCRAAAPLVVRPTRMAGIVDNRPWKSLDNGKPSIAECQNLTPEPWHQLAKAHPFKALSPSSIAHATLPMWMTVPNSYVRRIEFGFLAHSASSVRISQPLLAIAH